MTTNKKTRTLRATILILTTSFLVVHFLFWLLPNVFEPWNAQTVDQLFRYRSMRDHLRPRYDSSIVHVDISDQTLLHLNNSYLSRNEFARLERNLADLGTAAQLWDFIFPARTNQTEDSVFIAATARAKNVYFGVAFKLLNGENRTRNAARREEIEAYLSRTSWLLVAEGDADEIPVGVEPLATYGELASASGGLGHLNIRFDKDGVFRRVPLLVRYREGFYPSITLRVVCDYLKVDHSSILLKPGHSLTLHSARFPNGATRDIVIPIDKSGSMVVNFVGPWQHGEWSSMLHYDFADVLRASDDQTEMDIWREVMEGKIVIVSQVTTGSADFGPVPTDNSFPLSGVHANVLNTVLTSNFLTEAGGLSKFLIDLLLLGTIFVLATRFSSIPFFLGSLVVLVSYLSAAAALFLYGKIILDFLQPSLMIALSSVSVIGYRYVNEEKEKEVIRRSFEAYFPPAIVRKIVANRESITTGGHKKELTILFSDIKSFTTYSSTMTPDEIQKMLNEYFEAMVEIVFKHGGTVDKFIGDGLMVFFGDPEPQEDHAVRCVKAAIEMQKKCRELKVKWEKEGRFPLEIRIGINTGMVVVGNMGSSRRLSYTVLGSDVNLAQRLESNAPVEGIMISHRTYELVKDSVPTRPLDAVKVKGLEEAIKVYEVVVEA